MNAVIFQIQYADAWGAIVAAFDRAFMAVYAEARKNARRIMRLVVTLIPLMMLLVGSCKTAEMPGAYGGNAGSDQFRIALFPDQVNFKGQAYYPAEGYIRRAQSFVTGSPDSLKMLTEQEVGYILGKPAMQRKDASARIWQYRTPSCIIDVYFYDSRVSYVDMRRRDDLKPGLAYPAPLAVGGQSECLGDAVDHGDFSSVRI